MIATRHTGWRLISALDIKVAQEVTRIVSENVFNGNKEILVCIDHCDWPAHPGIGRHIEAKHASGLEVKANIVFDDGSRPVYQAGYVSYEIAGLVVCPDGHAFLPGQAIRIEDVGNVCPFCNTLGGFKFVGPRWGPADICPDCHCLPLTEVDAGQGQMYQRCHCGKITRII